MSTPSDHLDPKEATEAKLCAYLEGELPPNEHAEIEQHLTSHPQHRKLLADLAQTREWMRGLPRETAPGDLAESFQGQVERSMLLEDPDGRSMTIIRWPQLAMMAAIVTLTLGLGVTLVIILKGPAARNNVAIGPAGSPNGMLATRAASQPSSIDSVEHGIAAAPAEKIPAMRSAPVVAAVVAPPAASITAVPAIVDAPRKDLTVDEIKTQLLAAGYRPTGEVKSVCFVVRTEAVASSADQLQGFFSRHQLVLEQPASLTAKTFAMADQQPYTGVNGQRELQNSTNHATQLDTTQAAQNNANEAAANSPISPNANVKLAQQQVPAGGQNNLVGNDNTAAANTTQPVVLPDAKPRDMTVKAAGTPAGGFGGGGNASLATPTTPLAPAAGSDQQLYVAHNVTPLQLELLDASLAANNPNASVRRLTLSPGPNTAPGLITKGQTLIITVPQLVGPGMDKANVVRVSDDGTIILPMLDALPAAGVTVDELQQRIVTRYKDANLIPNATVSIATPPSTQPGPSLAAIPSTMPVGLVPTTNPTAATTQPAGGIDVIVVLEKGAAAGNAK